MLYQESLWTLVAWLKKMPWELKALNGIYLENYHLFFEDIFGSFVLFFFLFVLVLVLFLRQEVTLQPRLFWNILTIHPRLVLIFWQSSSFSLYSWLYYLLNWAEIHSTNKHLSFITRWK